VSFEKAEQLVELARMAAAYRAGITLDDVIERFGCTKRTAQRMLHALELQFIDTESRFDEEGRKRWRLPPAALRDLITLLPDELAALDLAISSLGRASQSFEAAQLEHLKEKILALVPRAKAARLETDYEALLEAQGLAARPGPRPRAEPGVMAAISEAVKACRLLEIVYRGRGDSEARKRRIAPLGVLLGLRRYVAAKDSSDMAGPLRLFRTDAISSAVVTSESFMRDPGFDLREFADRAFGTFQNEKEFGEVVWRFSPEAVGHAKEFEFHPGQVFEDQPDGSLIVRFHASGHLEMCWHLYAWGDKVEVLAPESLRKMVEQYRRNDFPALP
jgi:predicted DNA-binding transcriptional regulator YafY